MMNPKAAVVLGQPPTEEQLDELIASEQEAISQMASAQDKGLEASLPEVELSDSVKKNVLSVLNELAPLFKLDKLDSWDEQVWRRILASVQAVNDAVADDALAENLAINIDSLTGDNGYRMAVAKLATAARTMSFRKWLATPVEVEVKVEVREEPVAEEPMSDDAMLELFGRRA